MSTSKETDIVCDAWIAEAEFRIFDESFSRIRKCLHALSEVELWQRPNQNLASIGNLILHLNGNLRQYLVHGIGGMPDNRIRSEEFTASETHSTNELLTILDDLERDIRLALQNFKFKDLTRVYHIQGFELTGIGVITHTIEHLSYHTGQITWYTKFLRDIDLKYYGDQDLDVTTS